MGCGCSAKPAGNSNRNTIPNNNVQEDCTYTIESTSSWKTLLQCVNAADKLSTLNLQKSLYNTFLGILISIQNNPNVICQFKNELDIINPYILQIINQELC